MTHDETLAGVAPGARHAGRARDRGQLAAGPALRQPLRRAHRAREPARDDPLHAAGGRGPARERRPARQRDARPSRGPRTSCPRRRSRSSRTRTASSWARSCSWRGSRRATTCAASCRRPSAASRPRPPSEILAKVPWGKKPVRPRVLGDEPGDGRGAAQGDRRDEAHEPADELPEPDRRRADAEGPRQLPERDRERGRERRREHAARPRLGRHEAGEEGRQGRRRQAKARARRRRPSRTRRPRRASRRSRATTTSSPR